MNFRKQARRLMTPVMGLVVMMLLPPSSKSESLFVGFNTATPVQVYSTTGTYIQDLGPADAIAAIPTSSSYFFIEPSTNSTSTVAQYNASLNQIGSFTVNDLIDDGAAGANSLWLASYNGTVYQVSTSGSVVDQWTTGYNHVGVAFDGTYVYTTEGDGGSGIDKWSTTGTYIGQIATSYTGLYGLAYDPTTGDFWAGSTDFVYQIETNGTLLNTLDLTGDSRTPDGVVHDSISIGTLLTPVTTSNIPEPSTLYMFGAGMLLVILVALRRRFARVPAAAVAVACSAATAFGAVNVSVTPSVSTSQVGTTVTWTAKATDTSNASAVFSYQFNAGPSTGPLQMRRDFSTINNFTWTASDREGAYQIEAVVKSSTGASGSASEVYTVSSRVTGTTPVVSSANHPLVALYSVPPCPAGHTARVRFKTSSDTVWQATPLKTCTGTTSLNFYVAGMRASTSYELQQDVYNGPFDTIGPIMTFTTGAIPAGLNLVSTSIGHAASAPNSTAYPVVLTGPDFGTPLATDTQNRLIWYLSSFQQGNGGYLTRPVVGGTFLGPYDDNSGILGNRHLLREWDLAGNVLRETNTAAISAQLVANGTDPITSIHHEVFRFPNGDTGLLGSVEKVADQGAGPVDVVGDMAIVLDSNLQLKWWWNEFEHLDIKRTAVLGETCPQGNPGCPHLYNPGYSVANDWTHSNSLAPAPDGNLIISIRHQDWVIKLNYQNGSTPAWRKGEADNTIVWTLGKDGSFTVDSSDPYPWFSHQHDATYDAIGQLTLFDNGNTRITSLGGNSRGQAWSLDETHLVATPALNLDLGAYSFATGSAERLSNGNYEFYLGFTTRTDEYTPSGAVQFEQDLPANTGYRSFRMRSLYSEY